MAFSRIVFHQDKFCLRSGFLQLASVACRIREVGGGFKVLMQEALFTPH